MKVRPKKHLGQHFLNDPNIARKIAASIELYGGYTHLIELGPGTGALTRQLIELKYNKLTLLEIDEESIEYLKEYVPGEYEILKGDFLKTISDAASGESFGLIGNFPYNISSQIFFKVLELKGQVNEVVGMLQKEVAQRICANEGSKIYGILSVLLGAYYERELLFSVPKHVFKPPPKVESAVLRLKRKSNIDIGCDEKLFFRIVKQAFQMRRKTLRNALKPFNLPDEIKNLEILNLRPEQLSIAQFIDLTQKIEKNWKP